MSTVHVQISHSDTHAVVTVTNTEPVGDPTTRAKHQIDTVYCQDISGSMGIVASGTVEGGHFSGTRLQLCQETIVSTLRHAATSGQHRLGLVAFDNEAETKIPIQTVDTGTISTLEGQIRLMEPRGATNLSAGLQKALMELGPVEPSEGGSGGARIRYLMVFTDGMANQGVVTQEGLTRIIQAHRSQMDKGATVRVCLFAFGDQCNHELLQGIAADVDGTYYSLRSAEDIPAAIGEAFGTALETRQQNLEFMVGADLMETGSGEKPGFPDLLRGESRSRLFRLMNPETFREGGFNFRYLNCATGETVTVEVECSGAQRNEIDVSEAVNIQDVANTLKAAAGRWGAERRGLLEGCQRRVAESPSVDNPKVQKLLATIREQLELGDLCPPSLMRQYSENTRNFRGGEYASLGVSTFADESQRQVSTSMGASAIGNQPPPPPPCCALYPGAGANVAVGDVLPRPTLVSVQPGQDQTGNLTSPADLV
jgi:Mg-chelatase subunit ChlD